MINIYSIYYFITVQSYGVVQIVEYIMARKSGSFVYTLHNLIIITIIMHTCMSVLKL